MKVAVLGSTGLVGRLLVERLVGRGDQVVPVRATPGAQHDFIATLSEVVATADAVVNLAGANIAAQRWTPLRKDLIRESRLSTTRALAQILRRGGKPQVLVNASAIGFYGDRGEELLTEASEPGEGFLSATCRDWEAAALEARRPSPAAQVRVVRLRLGVVLSKAGGALAQMEPFARWGLGGPLGSGSQWMGWISDVDAVGVILQALTRAEFEGPLNVVAPEAVRQRTFAQTLGKVLGRPAFLPAPAWALRLAVGGMADELLLASAHVLPKRLEDLGFGYTYPRLEEALNACC